MPVVAWGRNFLEYLWTIGPATPGAMGPVPLTFCEIESWQRQVGLELQPAGLALLRRLSAEYVSESQLATKSDRQPPFADSSDAKRLYDAELQSKLDTFLS